VYCTCINIAATFVLYQAACDCLLLLTKPAGAQNRVGAIFFVINIFSFAATSALDVLHQERQVCVLRGRQVCVCKGGEGGRLLCLFGTACVCPKTGCVVNDKHASSVDLLQQCAGP
jgi:hypothetical protein